MGDTLLHLLLAFGSGVVGAVFAAGAVYTWVKMSIDRLEENATRIHNTLDAKVNKNFEVLDEKIDEKSQELKEDLSGIGGKVSRVTEIAQKRYHNMSNTLMFIAPITKEKEVLGMLKEEAS